MFSSGSPKLIYFCKKTFFANNENFQKSEILKRIILKKMRIFKKKEKIFNSTNNFEKSENLKNKLKFPKKK